MEKSKPTLDLVQSQTCQTSRETLDLLLVAVGMELQSLLILNFLIIWRTGSQVEINNIKSTNNTAGAGNTGFNGLFTITGIGSAKQFTVGLTTDPGTFSSDTSTRTTALPFFRRKRYTDTYYVYRLSESQRYISGEQDGVYYLSVLNASNSPTVSPIYRR